ncbi:DoxX family membrane protein [Geothrix paludis]|uniref:DoxX family membrane protein n=1 Tax=Geothrix paludis TaxID=2922722 RepID=UPI001FAC787A|nr:DoxX family membrane protein [Geothrix paludis]
MNDKLNSSWWALRIGLGAAPFLAGLDKYFNLLARWEQYLNPLVLRVIPVSPATFMHAIGLVEMAVGLAILTRWTRLGAYVAGIWLVGIALNLLTMGAYLDVAVRDLLLALAAYTLAQLTEVRETTAGSRIPGYNPDLA